MAALPASPASTVSRNSPVYYDQYLSDQEENLMFTLSPQSPWEPPSSDTGRAGIKLFSTRLKFRIIKDPSGYQSVFAIAKATFANVCFEVYLAKNKARKLGLEYYVSGIDETIQQEVVANAILRGVDFFRFS